MPMATFMRKTSLFMDADGLHFDLAQFGFMSELAGRALMLVSSVYRIGFRTADSHRDA
jgi:hypothetical protein